MFANNKDCRQYIYKEQPNISSLDDLFTLYGPCGFYGVSASVVADLASGLDKSVRLEPTINQEIIGDFDLTFTGFSSVTNIRPGSISVLSRANGGLVAVTSADGSTTFKSKGVDVVRYEETGVNMLEDLKMPIGYTSSNDNDVVVKSELTAVDAVSAKINQENTFSEKQNLGNGAEVTGLIDNTNAGIKHNGLAFIAQCRGNSTVPTNIVGVDGVTIARTAAGQYLIDCSDVIGEINTYSTANVRTTNPSFGVNVGGNGIGQVFVYPNNNQIAFDGDIDIHVSLFF
jgi:hypothetical protein